MPPCARNRRASGARPKCFLFPICACHEIFLLPTEQPGHRAHRRGNANRSRRALSLIRRAASSAATAMRGISAMRVGMSRSVSPQRTAGRRGRRTDGNARHSPQQEDSPVVVYVKDVRYGCSLGMPTCSRDRVVFLLRRRGVRDTHCSQCFCWAASTVAIQCVPVWRLIDEGWWSEQVPLAGVPRARTGRGVRHNGRCARRAAAKRSPCGDSALAA